MMETRTQHCRVLKGSDQMDMAFELLGVDLK